MEWLDRIRTELTERLAGLEPAACTASDARGLLDGFVALGKLADAGAVVITARALEGQPVGAAVAGLARSGGMSKAEAERMVATSKALPKLPCVRQALASGRLSRTQAAVVAEAAMVSPASESSLLRTASEQDLVGLRRHAERVKAACGDERKRRDCAHADRSFKTWVRDGQWHLTATGTVADGAHIELGHRPFLDDALAAARAAGSTDPFGAIAFDALVNMARTRHPDDNTASPDAERTPDGPPTPASGGGPSGATTKRAKRKQRRRRWQGVVRVDAAAIRRGHLTDGEVAEIIGVGPIDVATAVDLLGDATVRYLIKNGRDIASVATMTRHMPPLLTFAAAEAANWQCSNRGCSNQAWLDLDHNHQYAHDGPTDYANLNPLCSHCHDLKTHRHYRIHQHPDGTLELIAPDDPDPP